VDISGVFYGAYCLFNIPLLGKIFNVFYQVDCEGKNCFIPYLVIHLYPVTDDSRKEIPEDIVGKLPQTDCNVLVLCLCGSEC